MKISLFTSYNRNDVIEKEDAIWGTQNELVQRLEDGYNKFSKGQKKSWRILSVKIMIKQHL